MGSDRQYPQNMNCVTGSAGPTALGWALLRSAMHHSLPEEIAGLAQVGARLAGEDEARAYATARKNFRLWQGDRQPRPSTLAALNDRLQRAVVSKLQQKGGYGAEAAQAMCRSFQSAAGPFTLLAASYIPCAPNPAQKVLLDHSACLDQIDTLLLDAIQDNSMELAKTLLLGSNWLDDQYWSFPEKEQEDPRRNREKLHAATSWADFRLASAPLAINIAISWLSTLELAVLPAGRERPNYCPLFLPLATRFTPAAAEAIREGRALPAGKWSDIVQLPVPNLIVMLQGISSQINRRLQQRPHPPKPLNTAKGYKEKCSTDLSEMRRHDILSVDQFDALLRIVAPDDQPRAGEGCGFDVYALHLATNLFSLLTPRDGMQPTNDTRRIRPKSITVCEQIPDVYKNWRQRSLEEMAKDAVTHPWPE